MAEGQIVPDFQSLNFIVQDVTLTGRKLGEGSYGMVEEAEIQGTTCVVKKLHETLLPDPTEALGADRMIATFVAECRLMSNLHHPHIVQFLGICFLPGSRLPALLMEKLSTDLHNLLIKNADIPLDLKCSFLVGIAKGLTYLHNKKPPIIHRDLTARNILLNSAMVAKIADLGNARIINAHSSGMMTGRKMTRNPGNMWYMPPEVQEDVARYDNKIDIFSFGVIILFILTQKFPDIKNATFTNKMGRVFGRSEIERRCESFTQIHHDLSKQHPLAQLADLCLQNLPTNRPSIAAVMNKLVEARAVIPEEYSHRSKLDMVYMIQDQHRELESKQVQLATVFEQSKANDHRIMKQQQDIEVQQRQIEMRQGQIESQRSTLMSQNSQIDTLRQELAAKTRKVETQQERVEMQQARVQELQEHITALQEHNHTRNHHVQAATNAHERPKQVSQKFSRLRVMQYTTTSFHWEKRRPLPLGVADAQSTIANGRIYLSFTELLAMEQCFTCLGHILEYSPSTDDWVELPTPPVQHFALAAISNLKLVLVGGKMSNKVMLWEGNQRKWVANAYPLMLKARYNASAVGYKQFLVVAGGKEDNGEGVCTVEVLDTMTSLWYKAEDLPIRCSNMTPLVISDMLFLFYKDWSERHIAVLAASLPTLIEHATSRVNTAKTMWMTIPKAPLYRYAPFTVGNSLLIAGGTKDALYTEKSCEIFCYSAPQKEWVVVGHLPAGKPRLRSTCVGLGPNEFLMIGGDPHDMLRSVYKGVMGVKTS